MNTTNEQARHNQEAKQATYIAAWLDGVLGLAKVIVGTLVGSAAW
ncbi:hypothetical protein Q427_21000 [Halomonas sp. BC04]|nr:hypothetical protein Q427_21000 [Halomonas sp. BC04]